jgi:hypothetical protein
MSDRCRVFIRADDVKVEFDRDTMCWDFVRNDWAKSDLTAEELEYVQIVVENEAKWLKQQT